MVSANTVGLSQSKLFPLIILEVGTGKVFGKCIDNHTVETLIEVFSEHVLLQRKQNGSNMKLHYLCDNLSNHSCHEFCETVAKLCDVEYPREALDRKAKRQEWLGRDDKNIIIHFTPTHGSWLNMVEIWFGILNQRCINCTSFETVESLKQHIENFIETWNKHFAHPFKWCYKGEDLHGKVVRRFIRHIDTNSSEMGLSFLVSQFELMHNLVNVYFCHVEIKNWQLLMRSIENNKTYLHSIITESEQLRLKQQALVAYGALVAALEPRY